MRSLFFSSLLLGSACLSTPYAQEEAFINEADTSNVVSLNDVADSALMSTNIFVQDPAVFHKREADLQSLKSSLQSENSQLDSLLDDASRIAEMNDQCAVISLTETIDSKCWHFYQVDLPAFEERYMRITGEVRLGYMEMTRGLNDRKIQINACVDALYSLAFSKDQFLNLEGGVFVEPLSQGFQANYDFKLQYEVKHREHAFEIAKKWGETCREMVIRQDGAGFAPFFLERLAVLNETLQKENSLAVYKVDSSAAPTLFMDIAKAVRSAYYLNGVKLFHSRIAASELAESHLQVRFEKESVVIDGVPYIMKNGAPIEFKGSVDFPEKSSKLNGRWFWENQGNTEGVDFGPEYDEDSLAVARAAEEKSAEEAEQLKASEENKQIENRRGTHASVWAAITGVGMIYDNVAAHGYDLEQKDLFIMPDLAAAVRVRLNFGETAEGFVSAGVGGMLGFAIGKSLDKVYVAPLAQFELGYKNYGFRETAVFPIAGSGEEQWFQFRSGIFYSFGMLGVELGHSLVSNMGNGAYLGVFLGL